jgi:hypothetical protein
MPECVKRKRAFLHPEPLPPATRVLPDRGSMPGMGMWLAGRAFLRRIGSILGELSEDEHRAGRPLISAVVVASETAVPGGGFFELARRLGLLKAEEKDSFYIQELRRVYDYWSGSRVRDGQ